MTKFREFVPFVLVSFTMLMSAKTGTPKSCPPAHMQIKSAAAEVAPPSPLLSKLRSTLADRQQGQVPTVSFKWLEEGE
jgi:hypothetical protein